MAGVCACAVALGAVCTELGVPASWIFAFLVSFGAYAILSDRQTTPPTRLMQPAQVVIAMVCVAPLVELDGATVAGYVTPTVLALVVTLAVCAAAAFLLHRSGAASAVSALLATLAGGASGMTVLAAELKEDVRFVVLTQYLRLSLVVLTLPAFVHLFAGGGDAGAGADAGDTGATDSAAWWSPEPRPVLGALVVWGLVWLLVRLTRRVVKLPVPYLLLSILLTWGAGVAGVPDGWLRPEGLLLVFAYAVIGVQAGGTLTKSALRQFSHSLPLILAAVASMIVGAIVAALLIAHFSGVPLLDAYLATVPGGIYAVLAFAHEAGSEPIVTVVQVMRTLAMLVIGAYLPTIIGWWGKRRHA
ncbi:AbrB family transcriptional regulator [Corynebacterium sp.]|uniref:AbrB family transcriptional regulator n=1 Tax=Corynebacterium sp. TaxID=1720 RepID=UPI0028A6697F|nr:AbrB family transcriptional regulator [Corynebacterium sp.]